MSDIKVFHGVTAAIFTCVKIKSKEEHGTIYNPPDGNKGTATTTSPLGLVELGFDLDSNSGDLTYTVIRHGFVPISMIWSGIGDTIDSCRA